MIERLDQPGRRRELGLRRVLEARREPLAIRHAPCLELLGDARLVIGERLVVARRLVAARDDPPRDGIDELGQRAVVELLRALRRDDREAVAVARPRRSRSRAG